MSEQKKPRKGARDVAHALVKARNGKGSAPGTLPHQNSPG